MGHHKSRYRPPYGGRDVPPPRYSYDPEAYVEGGRGPGDGGTGRRRIPAVVILAALAVWTLLAFGAWLAVDPVLVWIGGLVAPVLDMGAAVGGVVGVGKEVGAVIDASRADGIAMWFLGVLGWLAKPAILIVWVLGALAILIGPGLLRRARGAGLSRFLH